MASYEYVGCVTGFSEGGKNTLWQPKALPMAVDMASGEYAKRLVEVGLLGSDGGAVVQPLTAYHFAIPEADVQNLASQGKAELDFMMKIDRGGVVESMQLYTRESQLHSTNALPRGALFGFAPLTFALEHFLVHQEPNTFGVNEIRFINAIKYPDYTDITTYEMVSFGQYLDSVGENGQMSMLEIVNAMLEKYGYQNTTDTDYHTYIMPFDEAMGKQLIPALAKYYQALGGSAYGHSDPNNWELVYDPVVVSTVSVSDIADTSYSDAHEVLATYNADTADEHFSLRSNWVIRYIGPLATM